MVLLSLLSQPFDNRSYPSLNFRVWDDHPHICPCWRHLLINRYKWIRLVCERRIDEDSCTRCLYVRLRLFSVCDLISIVVINIIGGPSLMDLRVVTILLPRRYITSLPHDLSLRLLTIRWRVFLLRWWVFYTPHFLRSVFSSIVVC